MQLPSTADATYLTATALADYDARVSAYNARRHIPVAAHQLSAGKLYPLWDQRDIDRFAARRDAIAAAVAKAEAELDSQVSV